MYTRNYKLINIVGLIVFIIIIAMLSTIEENKILFGVLARGLFSLLVIFNALYLVFTDKATFIIRKSQEKRRKLIGILLLVVGITTFITALRGYGINGYPLLDWRSILK